MEIALIGAFVVILILIAERYLHEQNDAKERRTVINSLLARTPQEFTQLETVLPPEELKDELPEDLVPMDEVGDDDFEKLIKGN